VVPINKGWVESWHLEKCNNHLPYTQKLVDKFWLPRCVTLSLFLLIFFQEYASTHSDQNGFSEIGYLQNYIRNLLKITFLVLLIYKKVVPIKKGWIESWRRKKCNNLFLLHAKTC
jgi:hypothetical protein